MAIYAIGDVHGCYNPLLRLIDSLNFDPSKDKLWFVGDLVNRGPKSLETLRFIKNLGDSAVTVLGNHDLHLLALHSKVIKNKNSSCLLKKILDAPDANELCQWLRYRQLAHYDQGLNTIMIHAGIFPTWSWKETMKYAAEVEIALRANNHHKLLKNMYGNNPVCWSENLDDFERLRFIINCLTRIRAVTLKNQFNFSYKESPKDLKENLIPWYSAKKRKNENIRVVFGHWSQLSLMVTSKVMGIDTSCVWGKKLTAIRLDSYKPEITQVSGQILRS